MIDKKAKKWAKDNRWFGKKKLLTLIAIYFHEELIDINVNPKTEKYYKIINLFMKPFINKKINLKSRPKMRKTVKLTQTQIDIAKRLRVPITQYTNQLNSEEW